MTHYNKYSSVVPSEMNNNELRGMCTELQTCKNWGMLYAKVLLPSGLYNNPVGRLKDYQQAFKTNCSNISI
jgi:hypothetical protein